MSPKPIALHIRPAAAADEALVVEFNAALARETEHLELDRDVLSRGVRAVLADPAKARYFIAEADGRPVGQLMLTLEWSDWRNGEVWWIQSVYVTAAHRRRGVFTRLYEHVEQLARAGGAVGLRLYVVRENHAAQATYRAVGMSLSDYVVMMSMWNEEEGHTGPGR